MSGHAHGVTGGAGGDEGLAGEGEGQGTGGRIRDGEGHAALFVDGIMAERAAPTARKYTKLRYNKMAFTLIDARTGKAVRVSLKRKFSEKALSSPPVQKEKKGYCLRTDPPQLTTRRWKES